MADMQKKLNMSLDELIKSDARDKKTKGKKASAQKVGQTVLA